MRTFLAGSVVAVTALFFLTGAVAAATPEHFSAQPRRPVHYPAPYPAPRPAECSFTPRRLVSGEGVSAFCGTAPRLADSRPARAFRVVAECADDRSHWFVAGPIEGIGERPSSAFCQGRPFERARLIDYRIGWF